MNKYVATKRSTTPTYRRSLPPPTRSRSLTKHAPLLIPESPPKAPRMSGWYRGTSLIRNCPLPRATIGRSEILDRSMLKSSPFSRRANTSDVQDQILALLGFQSNVLKIFWCVSSSLGSGILHLMFRLFPKIRRGVSFRDEVRTPVTWCSGPDSHKRRENLD